MKLRIYTTKDPEVRKISTSVELSDLRKKELQDFIQALPQAMVDFNGIGLASCQVGRNIRVVVVTKEYTNTPEHLVLVNPRLVSVSEKLSRLEQGCLSVPGVYGTVERPAKVRVKAFLPDGTAVDIKAKGMFAQVLQHELDHLDGVLFIDKATDIYEYEPQR